MSVNHLQFTEPFGDARVEELKLLSAAAYGRLEIVSSSMPDGPWRDLLVSLVWNDLVTMFTYEWGQNYFRDGASAPNLADGAGIRGGSWLERAMTIARIQGVLSIYENRSMVLHLTHPGRVRLSELKQALRAAREREP